MLYLWSTCFAHMIPSSQDSSSSYEDDVVTSTPKKPLVAMSMGIRSSPVSRPLWRDELQEPKPQRKVDILRGRLLG